MVQLNSQVIRTRARTKLIHLMKSKMIKSWKLQALKNQKLVKFHLQVMSITWTLTDQLYYKEKHAPNRREFAKMELEEND
jgi:hypothetical protein